jgi:hypothetical protein
MAGIHESNEWFGKEGCAVPNKQRGSMHYTQITALPLRIRETRALRVAYSELTQSTCWMEQNMMYVMLYI